MVAKLMDCNYNILIFIYALPLDVHVEVGRKVDGVDVEVDYNFCILSLNVKGVSTSGLGILDGVHEYY
jgi:hypothetical protein